MSDERLKPCPFCGGEAICIERASNYPYIYGVMCMDCHCRTSFGKDTDKVIKTWNTRKPMERIVERFEKSAEFYQKRWIISTKDADYGRSDAYEIAAEIVKGGGVDE